MYSAIAARGAAGYLYASGRLKGSGGLRRKDAVRGDRVARGDPQEYARQLASYQPVVPAPVDIIPDEALRPRVSYRRRRRVEPDHG